jgi:hypothetical protein
MKSSIVLSAVVLSNVISVFSMPSNAPRDDTPNTFACLVNNPNTGQAQSDLGTSQSEALSLAQNACSGCTQTSCIQNGCVAGVQVSITDLSMIFGSAGGEGVGNAGADIAVHGAFTNCAVDTCGRPNVQCSEA